MQTKILLLHGWNYGYYDTNKSSSKTLWDASSQFISLLEQEGYDVIMPAFPGFIGYNESEPRIPWSMDDYVTYCNHLVAQHVPDVILGYSFGGAVAAVWKSRHTQSRVPIVLVAPALMRKYTRAPVPTLQFLKRLIPQFLTARLRDLYLTYVVRNPYYIYGTRFLRLSYLNIVQVVTVDSLALIRPNELSLVYGSNDTATPAAFVQDYFAHNQSILDRITVINGASHTIMATHPERILQIIKNSIT